MSAVSDWNAYVQNLYALRNSKMQAIMEIQTAISNATAAAKVSYSISGPTGGQQFDWNGQLNSLTTALNAEMTALEGLNKLILQIPYQSATPQC